MEWFILHGHSWVPQPLRLPLYLGLCAWFLYTGLRTPFSVAPFRRSAFFCLSSASYFCIASPYIMLDKGSGFDYALAVSLSFLAAAVLLFYLSRKRDEEAVAANKRKLERDL